MSSEHPWWVKALALLTGKTETQIAWRLRQKREEQARKDSEPAPTPPPPLGIRRKQAPWWHGVVPEFAQDFPVTFALGVLCVLWYALGVLSTGGDVGAFSVYTNQYLGATNGILIHSGEVWRIITSNFVHHDLLHLGFNLYAFALAGKLVEELFGSAKALFAFLLTGVIAMGFSHLLNTYVSDIPQLTSGGASGALCGMIGMALVGGHRLNTRAGIAVRDAMIRWAIYLVLFGFLIPFVNNAAHGGGFVAGCFLGFVLRFGLGRPSSVRSRALGWLSAVFIIGALMLQVQSWDGAPGGVRGLPRSIFGMTLEENTNLRFSELPGVVQCVEWSPPRQPTPEDVQACTHMTKAVPQCLESWQQLERQGRLLGNDLILRRAQLAQELDIRPCFR